ncbi:hypothetical protein BKA70DRAFT_1414623 [Coprinopsis sp. MPI-PUGE-AT-0042]|nr:hypothetical protein BKA70DRAFT_1414623 [Coprinopsis sp. MPI-PUGE-AT-0042]
MEAHPLQSTRISLIDARTWGAASGDGASLRGPHRSLHIAEIVDDIFGWLIPRPLILPGLSDTAASTLAALARTCRAFHTPAVKHLWSRLYNLRPLVSLFPKSAWRFQQEGSEMTLYPSRSFDEKVRSAMQRLRLYTHHVRWIHCNPFWASPKQGYRRYKIHYSAIQALSGHPSLPHPLFPHVRRVNLGSDLGSPLETVFCPALVLSPSVQEVSISVDTCLSGDSVHGAVAPSDVTSPAWLGLAGHLADIAPQLSSFKVEMYDLSRWAGRIPALLEAFSELSVRLTHLNISPLIVTAPAIAAIGRLTGLTNLHLSLFDFQLDELDDLRPLNLPSLDQIAVDTNSIPACIKFFQAMCAMGLRSLSLSCLLQSDTDLVNFFSVLRDCGTYSQLVQINVQRIHSQAFDEPVWKDMGSKPRFTFTQSTAGSLVPFKCIEQLSIGPCKPLQIADNDVGEMFTSWPSLKVFELNDDVLTVDYQAPRLTLSGIHKALQTVPCLEKLTLSFDGSTIPSPSCPTATEALPHPALSTWNVCSSSVVLPTKLAAWLKSHYPALSTLDFFTTYMAGLRWMYRYNLGNGSEGESVDMDSFEEEAVMVDRWTSVRAKIGVKRTEEGR